jgi:hypothetical protein
MVYDGAAVVVGGSARRFPAKTSLPRGGLWVYHPYHLLFLHSSIIWGDDDMKEIHAMSTSQIMFSNYCA